ncbi:hypothetical protein [Staphylococcus phage PT94]
MSRLLKCYGEECQAKNIKHPSDKLSKLSGKNYCPDCYEKEIEERRQKNKLNEYIKQVYNIPFVPPLMLKHIKQFRESGLSYKKIYALIHYCHEIKKGYDLPPEKYGLIVLGNYYSEMIQYYKNKKHQKEKNQGKENKQRTVTINPETLVQNKYKDSFIIDMEDL